MEKKMILKVLLSLALSQSVLAAETWQTIRNCRGEGLGEDTGKLVVQKNAEGKYRARGAQSTFAGDLDSGWLEVGDFGGIGFNSIATNSAGNLKLRVLFSPHDTLFEGYFLDESTGQKANLTSRSCPEIQITNTPAAPPTRGTNRGGAPSDSSDYRCFAPANPDRNLPIALNVKVSPGKKGGKVTFAGPDGQEKVMGNVSEEMTLDASNAETRQFFDLTLQMVGANQDTSGLSRNDLPKVQQIKILKTETNEDEISIIQLLDRNGVKIGGSLLVSGTGTKCL